jgi:hypothetical protein
MDASAILAMMQIGQPNIGALANSYSDLLAELRPLNAVQTAATFAGLLALGGHLKTGHTCSLQNRPTELAQNKSIYTVREAIL